MIPSDAGVSDRSRLAALSDVWRKTCLFLTRKERSWFRYLMYLRSLDLIQHPISSVSSMF